MDQKTAAAPVPETPKQDTNELPPSPHSQALALQATAKALYEKQNYLECLDHCKEALKLSCNSELLTLVACSQVHCSVLDSAELHVNMSLALDPQNGLALDLRAMLQEFIHKDYAGALEDLQMLQHHSVYKKPGLDEIIARVEGAMNECTTARKETALKHPRHAQADIPDISQERMAARERASAVVKTYLERAVFLQQEWEDRYIRKKAGAGSSEITQTKSGAKQEGAFTLAAAMELLSLIQQQLSEDLKLRRTQTSPEVPEANGQLS